MNDNNNNRPQLIFVIIRVIMFTCLVLMPQCRLPSPHASSHRFMGIILPFHSAHSLIEDFIALPFAGAFSIAIDTNELVRLQKKSTKMNVVSVP